MITANILELLGAFFLGAIVTMAILWTAISIVIRDHGGDTDTDDEPPQPPTEKHA